MAVQGMREHRRGDSLAFEDILGIAQKFRQPLRRNRDIFDEWQWPQVAFELIQPRNDAAC